MSWMKRGQGSAAEQPAPPYQPQQPVMNQQGMFPGYQGVGNGQQQYWNYNQQPQYPQQYNSVSQPQQFPAQDYSNNANQYFQQQPVQYNEQHYSNQAQNNTQQGYQPQGNYYPNQQGQPQNFGQNKPADGWEDSWGDWGWDESSKQAMNAAAHPIQQPVQASQPQVFNNANVIDESFTSTDTWNWGADDKKDSKDHLPKTQDNVNKSMPVEQPVQDSDTTDHSNHASDNMVPVALSTEEIKTLNDREAVKERLPNLALGKRFHIENLTPQWSIESQMSQESSDGPHTHSESTYRSDNQSRNSSKSSPGLNTENSNFNYSQSGIDEFHQNSEWSKNSGDDQTLMDNLNSSSSRRESHDDLAHSIQEMSIANCENPKPDVDVALNELETSNVHDLGVSNAISQPVPSSSPASFPPPAPASSVATQPGTMMPPPPPATSSIAPPTNPLAAHPPTHTLPPTNYPTSSTNPFKHAGPFSHKTISKASASNASSNQPFVPQMPSPNQHFTPQVSSTNLTSPAVVNKVSQNNRVTLGYGANLETTPDNSERPDQPPVATFRPVPVAQQIPDNLEVAPQNDRNEYLQTAHLSSSDYVENTDFSRNIPPPGLRRMVVGQQEFEYNQNLNISGDEPPPGLARMVPGQQNETDNTYNQTSDNYMDRHVDGQQTDNSGRPYRQADGQQTLDNYSQPPPSSRNSDRRPIGLDRMVPGEPSNDEYSQYQPSNYGDVNEQRVVTGVDHDYPSDAGPSDIREQNLEGSDYTEHVARNASRNLLSGRDVGSDAPQDYPAPPDDLQREVTMEGENLQDLSVISSTELTMSREEVLDGADVDNNVPREAEVSGAERPASSSRRQSRVNTSGEDSERDRAFRASPRRDRDRDQQKPSRDRDGRYSREDRKHSRRRDHSPESRSHRRHARSHRYETEDTDYYSDREREKRRYREGSYASKPPRPEDKERYTRDRDRDERDRRRHNTSERRTRHEDERDRDRRRGRTDRDTYERHYRDIDPSRKYGNIRRERDEEDRRRGDYPTGGSRADSREAATDEELNSTLASTDSRRRHDRHRRRREHERSYYEPQAYGSSAYVDPYSLTRQQYAYYERLRVSDPAAYMAVYRQLVAGHSQPYARQDMYNDVGYIGSGYSGRGETHSGRSSAAGLKGTDTDLATDASLNLQQDESTARSERMTPFKYATSHTKGSITAGALVLVRTGGSVQVIPLQRALQHPLYAALQHYPGPLVKGVTHKKSVIEYCESRGAASGSRDVIGHALIWQLLALLLRQNGVVVGSDIAELLMKNTREYDYDTYNNTNAHASSDSASASRQSDKPTSPPLSPPSPTPEHNNAVELPDALHHELSSTEALDRFRELLLIGNRVDALECAMDNGLWAHALVVSMAGGRRARAAVQTRFMAAQARADPLRTLYHALTGNHCVVEQSECDWRPHAAILLANPSARPDQDRRTLTLLGDHLSSRGLVYCAQFVYMSAGVPFSRHPLAPLAEAATATPSGPPRLSLLLADPKVATLDQFATNDAIFATEIYEYAMSLNQDYVVKELQVYKFLLACRLCDVGLYERALGYLEGVAKAASNAPGEYPRPLLNQLAYLADRLQYHDSSLAEEPADADSEESSPRHARVPWIHQLTQLAVTNAAELSQHSTPQHDNTFYAQQQQQQHSWDQQQQQQPQQPVYQPVATYPEAEEAAPVAPPAAAPATAAAPAAPPAPAEYSYYQPPPAPAAAEPEQYWQRQDESANQTYADPYWQDQYSYVDNGQHVGGAIEEESRPMITMPGAPSVHASGHAHASSQYNDYEDERPGSADQNDQDEPKSTKQESKSKEDKESAAKGKGWLGGIFNKLSLRAPNQMILPDDKNPTIVWDEEHKRWKNLDADESDVTNPPPPPPKMSELPPHVATSSPLQPPGAPGAPGAPPLVGPPTSNIFKMQKGRHIKKSYVDVFNPKGAAPLAAPPPPAELLPPAPAALPHNYFVPAMPTQNDVYDPRHTGDRQYRSGI